MILVAVIGQTLFLLLISPGVNGIIKAAKARLQSRRGPPLLQGYYDIAKWLRKGNVYSSRSSWISRVAPVSAFAATLCAGLLVPTVVRGAPLDATGDFIVVVYLFSLARFMTALSGLDAAGAFGGEGSSREMAISAIAEPVLLLAFFIVVAADGTTIISHLSGADPAVTLVSDVFAFVALFIVTLAETGRVPIDNPDTHLELTMVHEGMILEAAGPNLGLFQWAHYVKQTLLLSLLVNVFAPWGLSGLGAGPQSVVISVVSYAIKIVLLSLALAVTETSMAKLRIFRVPDLLGTAFALALLGLAAEVIARA